MIGPDTKTALGVCCDPPEGVMEVVEVSDDRWLLRVRYGEFPPTNLNTCATREEANEYATNLAELTGALIEKIIGGPLAIKLAKDPGNET